ncbi:aminoglycoside phosphotransferase family protein [Neobacillus niacini]|uniref:phosphotransferase family protein n=1 Tax=Neobacillus niacini TaxID=86668 RepID=UPI00052F5878|nr:aminoglycoside phosphotransferase family protein [Neobacillus niacini]KGM46449.1 aminoglycoside phosphotransferase [Neobacillus niacini]MEC1524315.1 aminoglycoside phosphotransferase family protein [Neobacillus niacini]
MEKYIECINQVYPSLSIKDCQLNDIGQNNDVIIVNGSIVFRFPKYPMGIDSLKRETEILEAIQNTISIPIPNPIYQSFQKWEVGKVFVGYELIKGSPLWKASIGRIKNEEVLKSLASQLVNFLLEIHSISKNKLQLEETDPREQMVTLYQKIQNKLYPFMRAEIQRQISYSFETFLNSEACANLNTTLVHGDFGATNILWEPTTYTISGIIDFGGSGRGDQAYDLAGILSSYGEDFFNMCLDLYPNGAEIAERVRFYRSTFALQEALHGVENNDVKAFENGIKAYR